MLVKYLKFIENKGLYKFIWINFNIEFDSIGNLKITIVQIFSIKFKNIIIIKIVFSEDEIEGSPKSGYDGPFVIW